MTIPTNHEDNDTNDDNDTDAANDNHTNDNNSTHGHIESGDQSEQPTETLHSSTFPPINMAPKWMMTIMMTIMTHPFILHFHTLGCFQNYLQHSLDPFADQITNILANINDLCQSCGLLMSSWLLLPPTTPWPTSPPPHPSITHMLFAPNNPTPPQHVPSDPPNLVPTSGYLILCLCFLYQWSYCSQCPPSCTQSGSQDPTYTQSTSVLPSPSDLNHMQQQAPAMSPIASWQKINTDHPNTWPMLSSCSS